MVPMPIRAAVVLCSLCMPSALPAEEQRIDYLKDIKPVLQARCYACHGALKQKRGLRLDTVASMKKGGDSGAALVAGNSARSLLCN